MRKCKDNLFTYYCFWSVSYAELLDKCVMSVETQNFVSLHIKLIFLSVYTAFERVWEFCWLSSTSIPT